MSNTTTHEWRLVAGAFKCARCGDKTKGMHTARYKNGRCELAAKSTSQYPWHEAPEWAQFAAIDSNGVAYWYDGKPTKLPSCWLNTGFRLERIGGQYRCLWENSLEERPTTTNKYTLARVQFDSSSKLYTYKAPRRLNLQVGDRARVADGAGAGKWVTVKEIIAQPEGDKLNLDHLRTIDAVHLIRPTKPKHDPTWGAWNHVSDPAINTALQPENEPMSVKIENVTYVTAPGLGRIDITKVSDDQVFHAISKIEGELNSLNSIKNKPKRLVRRIAELNAGLSALINRLDELDGDDASVDPTLVGGAQDRAEAAAQREE